MQASITVALPEHLKNWLHDKNIFKEDTGPEAIILACLEDAYEDDHQHGEDDEHRS